MTGIRQTTEFDLDPITIEIVTQRLVDITAETADTLERVGGTVNTVQMKDYITAIYRRDGALVSTAAALFFHVYCAGRAVREVIDRFGTSIKAGDMFILNDPYIAAIHQSDLYLISPIFFRGELVGWSATFVHVMDIGAMSPGGNSPYAREIEHEGLRFGALRLVEDGVLRTDIVNLLAGMTRQPEMFGLDLRSEVAANFTARDRVVQLYERYGTELVEAVCERNIETTRKILESRLTELPNGTFHESLVLTIGKDEQVTFACELRKEGALVEFDFTRSSPQANVGVNLPVQATFGSCGEAILKSIARDLRVNEGLFVPIHLKTVPGTVVSVTYPAPTSLSTTSGGAATRFLAQSIVARLLATSERWRHTANARGVGHRSVRHAGTSQYGNYYVSVLSSLSGSGSSPGRDGADCSSGTATHNVEWLEEHFPLLQLYRRYLVKNPGGSGTFRGGLGEESAYILHNAPKHEVRLVPFGALGAVNGHGMFGGHPGASGEVLLYRSQQIPWAQSTVNFSCSGDPTSLFYDDILMRPDDVLILRASSGPGTGDPLLRPVELVLRDVKRMKLLKVDAAQHYGVVIKFGAVDSVATNLARKHIRETRNQLAVEAGWLEPGSPSIMMDARCDPLMGKCAGVATRENHPGFADFPTVTLGAKYVDLPWSAGYSEPHFVQTFCPACWTLIDFQLRSLPVDD